MPRMGRLNLPGGLFHVIGRGLERRQIFSKSSDKKNFLERLGIGIKASDHSCYAWALMDNHYHLLLRQGQKGLSTLLGPLLGAYAQSYNKRHNRVGYLYQGRYKSILCEEDSYFLELIRYIHLNPIKAKMINDVTSLEKYPWTSHSVILGKQKLGWLESEEVLSFFGRRKRDSRKSYRQFIAEGINSDGFRNYEGGGLIRSCGGWEEARKLHSEKNPRLGDERILGGDEFVQAALRSYDKEIEVLDTEKSQNEKTAVLLERVCTHFSITAKDISHRGRNNKISMARGLASYWGVTEYGLSTVKLGELLNMSHQGVSNAIRRGRTYATINGV